MTDVLLSASGSRVLKMTGGRAAAYVSRDMARHIGERVGVDLIGGREIEGILKGFDAVGNLILDSAAERSHEKRELGLAFVRGPSVLDLFLLDGIIVV